MLFIQIWRLSFACVNLKKRITFTCDRTNAKFGAMLFIQIWHLSFACVNLKKRITFTCDRTTYFSGYLSSLLETLSNSRRQPGGRPPSAPQPGSRSTSFGGKNKTKQTCRRRVDEAIFLLSLPLSPVRMASLRNTREALLLGYSEGWLDEMEFLALYDLNTSENLEFPYDSYDQFNLDDIDEAECIAEFRFEKRHILQLEEVLQIPALLKCDQKKRRKFFNE